MKNQIKLKNLTFRKEIDRLEICHQLSHTTLNITLDKNEMSILTDFLNRVGSSPLSEEDMRIPGVGC